jgi:hypothetical protein
MDKGIMGAIYWRLHTAFLKNDRKTADTMLGMLEDEANHCDYTLCMALGSHFDRFSRIRYGIKHGNYGRLYDQGEAAPENAEKIEQKLEIDESKFHTLLLGEGKQKFLSEIGASSKASIVHEFEMDPYGRCDFLIRDGRTWHVVEVKIGQAPTSVVSQIDKYRLFSELQMCLGLHDEVKAAVIAQSFPTYVAGELSRISVSMLLHRGDADSLKKIIK